MGRALDMLYQAGITEVFAWVASHALDGGRADKESFPRIIQAYVSQMQASELPYFITDSALYSLACCEPDIL